jgi:hypothetical protein
MPWAAALAAWLFAAMPACAQTRAIDRGDVAVSGFSGTILPEGGLAPGVDPLDKSFIDPDGATVRVFDMSRLGAGPRGQLVQAPAKLEVTARRIGQVFGLAFVHDPSKATSTGVPDLFAAATSFYGVQIVGLDLADGGRPIRLRRGTLGALFMEGQWGAALGGGPGSIWRIDGRSGVPTLFANVRFAGLDNSGPGLGDIAFDTRSRNLYITDLDTGLIHRLDLGGADLGQFDHGVDGRPRRGLSPVPDDGRRMDITSAAFATEDPATWGITQPERRVLGLAVHEGRLYYAAASGPEVWSVGLGPDGGFVRDARFELAVASNDPAPVTDIVFDARGRMYLAQRGALRNRYDFSEFTESGRSRVLRYTPRASPDPVTAERWLPAAEEYAIGFFGEHRNSVGGIALQYGYRADGTIDYSACEGTLLASGDRLRENSALARELATGGSTDVQGVQLTALGLVRPANVPPRRSHFVDYDGLHLAPEERGHVGDVEVYHVCDSRAALAPPPGVGPPASPPTGGLTPPPPHTMQPPPPGKEPPPPPPGKEPPPPPGKQPPPPPPGAGPMLPKPCTDPKRLRPDGTCCPSGQVWQASTSTCDPAPCPPVRLKPDGTCCPSQKQWHAATQSCVPQKLPCLNPSRLKPDGTCCPFGSTWNVSTKSCDDLCPPERKKPNGLCCPETTKWNAQSQSCGPLQDEPNIKVDKRSTVASCQRETACSFEVVVTNTGPGSYTGPIVLDEKTLPAAAAAAPANPPWACQSVAGGYRCTHPQVTLAPGQSRTLVFKCTPGQGWPGDQITNCASFNYAASGKKPFGKLTDDKACVSLPVCKPGEAHCCPPNLKVEKKAAVAFCTTDGGCTFEITITNTGLGAYSGPIVIDETTAPGAAQLAAGSQTAPWACTKTAGGYRCTHPTVVLAPGQSRKLSLTFVPGPGWSGSKIRNCAGYNLAASGKLPFGDALDDEDCAEIPLAQAKLSPPPPACSDGMVLNAAGRCVCPEGTAWSGRRCVEQPGRTVAPTSPSPVTVPSTQPPVVGVPATPRQPRPETCPDAERRKPDGSCCPQGQTWDGRRCRSKAQATCPPGTTGTPPGCRPIATTLPKCPAGTSGVPPNCTAILKAVPKPAPKCPVGTTGTPPNCTAVLKAVPIAPPKCPPGTVGVPPSCRAAVR